MKDMYEENEEIYDEAYAVKTTRDYSKKMLGKKKESLKREKGKSAKRAYKRVRDYEYDAFNDADLRRYF